MILPISYRQLLPNRGCVNPAWISCLDELDRALRANDWEESARHLRSILTQMLLFFTCASAGLVQKLEVSRPEIQALAEGLDSLVSYERLLRFSLSVLRTLDHPQREALLDVFLTGKESGGSGVPPQGRWLQLSGPSSDSPPLLSALDECLRTVTDTNEQLLQRLEALLGILSSWLQDSRSFLASFECELQHTPEGPLAVALGNADFSFPLMPSLAWSVAEQLAIPSQVDSQADQLEPAEGYLSLSPEDSRDPGDSPFELDRNEQAWQGEGPSARPAPPSDPWNSTWSTARTEERLAQVYPPLAAERCPTEMVSRIRRYCQEERRGYILLEGPPGAGKSLIVSSLLAHPEPGTGYAMVVFPVRQTLQSDFQTFIEVFDERLHAPNRQRILRPLGHRVTRELNVRYPAQLCSERFFAYLSGLLLLNGSRIVIVLDGLDEVFEGSESKVYLSDFLPDTLPDGAFILLTAHRESCASRMVRRLEALEAAGAERIILDTTREDYHTLTKRFLREKGPELENSRGLALSLLEHRKSLAESGLLTSALVRSNAELLPLAFEALERKRGWEPIELLLSLATIPGNLRIAALNHLGLSGAAVSAITEEWPSLLRYNSYGENRSIQLAHEDIRVCLLENYAHAYASCCRRLAQRASHFLNEQAEGLSSNQGSIDSREGFELMRRMLTRLHGWLLDSQDVELQKSVLSSPGLKKLRETVCNRLEAQGRFHHKLAILAGYRQCLSLLVDRFDDDSLREELAWAYNSRGLTYLRLGQFGRNLEEIEQAIELFRFLIEERHCESYRGGLAAALNRKAEALLYLGEPVEALKFADLAVQDYRTVVDRGQDLRHLLALALAHRARCQAAAGQTERAIQDYDQALTLYAQILPGVPGQHSNIKQVQAFADTLICRAEQKILQGSLRQAQQDLFHALQQIDALRDLASTQPHDDRAGLYSEFDWRILAVRARELQATAERTEGLHFDAIQRCDEALAILQELLDSGRLDVRDRTAHLLTLRGQLWTGLGEPDKAVSDLTHALAHLSRLIEFEGHPGLRRQRARTYLLRARHLQEYQRGAEALLDYEKAIEDYNRERMAAQLEGPSLFELARAYASLAVLLQKSGQEKSAADRLTSAIFCFESDPKWVANLCDALRLRAQSFRRLGKIELALADATQAIERLAACLEQQPDLRIDLARAHYQRGELEQLSGEPMAALRDYGIGLHLFNQGGQDVDIVLPGLCLARARLFEELKRPEEGLADLEIALSRLVQNCELPDGEEASRLHTQALLLKARLHNTLSQFQEALDSLFQALLLEGRQSQAQPELRPEICRALLNLQRPLEAVEHFLLLPETDDTRLFVDLTRQLRLEATQRLKKGQLSLALDFVRQELHLVQLRQSAKSKDCLVQEVEAINLMGWILSKMKRLPEAREAFQQACRLCEAARDEDDAVVKKQLEQHRIWGFKEWGVTLEAQRLDESALAIYDQALDWLEQRSSASSEGQREGPMQGEFAWVLLRQALVLARLRRHQEALAALSRSIDLDRGQRPTPGDQARRRLATSLILRARWRADEADHQIRAQCCADLCEALPILEEQEGDAPDPELVYCRGQLLLLRPTRSILSCSLDLLEAFRDGRPWESELTPSRMLVNCLQALPKLPLSAAAVAQETQRIVTAVELLPARTIEDFPAQPELFLRLVSALSSRPWPAENPQEKNVQTGLETSLLSLACRQAWLETRSFGSPGYPRMLHCLLRLGNHLLSLDASALQGAIPRLSRTEIEKPFGLILHYLENCDANPGWVVDLNNLARTWQRLPLAFTEEIGITGLFLQSLRRW